MRETSPPEARGRPGGDGQPVHVCTIAARNYLDRVRVLARSFLRHHPDGLFDVFVVDDRFGEVDLAADGIRVIRPDELSIAPRQLRAMALYYDVTEFSTSLKPWVIEAALDRTGGPVLYLDPDIEVFGTLVDLSERAREHGLVLVPHVLEPMPRDGCTPSEQTILLSGIYNLGFAGVGPAGRPFLSWWQERLATDAVIDHAAGFFTDQRWVDFAPTLFSCDVSHDPGCDVAYWNLHERSLDRVGGRIVVNGEPLRFFHYSGFDPASPHLLSKHAGDRPRILLSERPLLAELCRQYAEQVHAAADHMTTRPYAWGSLDNGVKVDRLMRRAYRSGLLASGWDAPGSPPDLTAAGGSAALVDWLCDLPPGARLPRYLGQLFSDRYDIAFSHARVPGADAKRLAEWLRERAGEEIGTSTRLVDRLCAVLEGELAQDEASVPPATGEGVGVDVIGLFAAESGVGEAARRTAAALGAAGVPCRLVPWTRGVPGRHEAVVDVPALQPADTDICIVHVNAELSSHVNHDFRAHLADRHRIGVWFWEVASFPDHPDRPFELVDEVWAASRFMRDAIGAVAPVPVLHMPLPFVRPPVAPGVTRRDVGMGPTDDEFVFLNVFDFRSVMERKNPLGLVDAYVRAFGPGDGARLVVKTINGAGHVEQLEQVRMRADGRPDIEVRDGHVDAATLGSLVALSDAYVSLHRAEGLGLMMADAMMCAKPTIATGYSGNTDFMTDDNSYLVPFAMREIGPGNAPYDPRGSWADPDVGAAAGILRAVFDDRDAARRRGERARADLEQRFSPGLCGARMAERFAAIRGERGGSR